MPAVGSHELQKRLSRLLGLWLQSVPAGWSGPPADLAEALWRIDKAHRTAAVVPGRNAVARVFREHAAFFATAGFTLTDTRTASGRIITLTPASADPPARTRTRVGYPCRKCGKPCDVVRGKADPEGAVRRVRQCTGCGRRFTTREAESATPGVSIDRILTIVRDSLESQFRRPGPAPQSPSEAPPDVRPDPHRPG